MAHHKRRRPKHQRNGCLQCKAHKDEREAKNSKSNVKASVFRKLQVKIDDERAA